MRLLLLGTKSTTEDSEAYYRQYLDFFKTSAQHSGRDVEVALALLEQLIISIGDGQFVITDTANDTDLSSYDMIVIRGHVREHIDEVKAVSVYAKLHGRLVLNDYSGFRSSSKLIQAIQFYEAGLPVAKTVLVTPALLKDESRLPFGFPCVMKATFGSHGHHNFLVHSFDELKTLANNDAGRAFVLQRFIPNDGDYRVLLAGDEVMVIKRSAASGSHLNNTSQGGRAELVPTDRLPAAIIEQSRTIATRLGMTIAGVDVLYDASSGEHSFLEVNSQPQLMTGAFVDQKAELFGRYLAASRPKPTA